MQLPDQPVLPVDANLILRQHQADDVDAIVEQCHDEAMVRWTTVPSPYTPADAHWFLDYVARSWADGTVATFAIELAGRFSGTIDLRLQPGAWADIGYGLTASARGQHIMSRSLRRVLDWGFSDLGLAGVKWQAQVGNDSSRQVAEACGFRVEGTVRGLLMHRGQRVDGWIGTLLAADRRS